MTVVTRFPRVRLGVHPNLLDLRGCAGNCLSGKSAFQLVAPRHMQVDIWRGEVLWLSRGMKKPRESIVQAELSESSAFESKV